MAGEPSADDELGGSWWAGAGALDPPDDEDESWWTGLGAGEFPWPEPLPGPGDGPSSGTRCVVANRSLSMYCGRRDGAWTVRSAIWATARTGASRCIGPTDPSTTATIRSSDVIPGTVHRRWEILLPDGEVFCRRVVSRCFDSAELSPSASSGPDFPPHRVMVKNLRTSPGTGWAVSGDCPPGEFWPKATPQLDRRATFRPCALSLTGAAGVPPPPSPRCETRSCRWT